MFRQRIPLFLFVLFLAALPSTAFAGKLIKAPNHVGTSYIVTLKADNGADGDEEHDDNGQHNGDVNSQSPKRRLRIERATQLGQRHGINVTDVFNVSPETIAVLMDDETAARVANDPEVAYVAEDGFFFAPTSVSTAPGSEDGNDAWNLDRLDQISGLDQQYYFANPPGFAQWGTGTRVYVVDSGVSRRQENFGNRVVDGYDAISKTPREGVPPPDATGADDFLRDLASEGHGTHVAAIIGGNHTGIARGVSIVPVRVSNLADFPTVDPNLNTNPGAITALMRGLTWIEGKTPGIVNMSLSFSIAPTPPTLAVTPQFFTQGQSPDATHFDVAAPPNITQGVPFEIVVTALDANERIAGGYTGTIHFTTSLAGGGPAIGPVPADYSFVASDAGQHRFTATFLAAPRSVVSQITIAVADKTKASLGGETLSFYWPDFTGRFYLNNAVLDQPVREQLARLVTKGFTVVLGAGNAGVDACNIPWAPQHGTSGLITVGATDRAGSADGHDRRGTFREGQTVLGSSNFGKCVDMWAPGVDTLGSGGTRFQGTSAATPHVSGVAAIAHTPANPTPGDIERYLMKTAVTQANLPTLDSQVTAFLHMNRPPRFRLVAHSSGTKTIYLGESATLSVTVDSTFTNPTFDWYEGVAGDPALSTRLKPNGTASVTITPDHTAAYWVRVKSGGETSDSDSVTITVITRSVIALGIATPSLCAGQTTTAVVYLDGPSGPAGTPVTITSTSLAIQVPSTITIGAGQTSGTFLLTAVSGPFPATASISAHAQSGTKSTDVTVQPGVYALTVSPATLSGGSTAKGVVQLAGPAPAAGEWITLTSSDPSSASVPASVFVPADSSFASFNITTKPKTTTLNVNITASICNTSKTATLRVNAVACTAVSVAAQPSGSTIELGHDAILSAAFNGNPAPSIQWLDSLGRSAGSGSSISVSPATTTSYSAIGSNFCSSATTNLATVTVVCNAPSLTTQPESHAITEGDSATLSVSTSGTAPVSVQWVTSTGTVTGSGATITVTPADTTVYYAVVTNPCGTATSAPATVTVCHRPSITTPPASMSVETGETATLTIGASGTAPLTIDWYSGGALVGTGSSLSVTPSSTTMYYAVVSNGCGSVQSSAATVTVCTRPAIVTPPQGESITAGDSVTLTVAASGTAPLTYQWRSLSGDVVIPVIDGTGPSITVSPLASTTYLVNVSNSCGSATASAIVNVCNPPAITRDPQPATIAAGQSAALSVDATGTAPLTITWYTSDGIAVGNGPSITVTPEATTIYHAVVANACGTRTSNPAQITVTACGVSPVITQQPLSTTIAAGSSVTLSVAATGTQLQYQWHFSDGTPLAGETGASLTIDAHATAAYYVVVSNACGALTSDLATITVICDAPAVTQNPQSATVTAGDPVTLTANGTGTDVTFTWYDETGALLGSGSSITFTPAVTRSYFCEIANACGSVRTSSALVTVNPACFVPVITGDPHSTTIHAGQTATLHVFAAGASVTLQWYRSNGTPISGATSNDFVFTPGSAGTFGFYAIATNPCGTARSSTATVTVICDPPVITSDPSETTPSTITSGQVITLHVVATGFGLQYQWYQQLPSDPFPQAVIGAGTDTLTAAPTQSGTKYLVKVFNCGGEVTSHPLNVTVN